MGLKLRPAGWISKFGLIAVVIFGSLGSVASSPAAETASPSDTATSSHRQIQGIFTQVHLTSAGQQFLAEVNITNVSQLMIRIRC